MQAGGLPSAHIARTCHHLLTRGGTRNRSEIWQDRFDAPDAIEAPVVLVDDHRRKPKRRSGLWG